MPMVSTRPPQLIGSTRAFHVEHERRTGDGVGDALRDERVATEAEQLTQLLLDGGDRRVGRRRTIGAMTWKMNRAFAGGRSCSASMARDLVQVFASLAHRQGAAGGAEGSLRSRWAASRRRSIPSGCTYGPHQLLDLAGVE